MSVRAFLSDDRYETGNPHFNGRIAGRYAMQERQDDTQTAKAIEAAVNKIPTVLGMFMLKEFMADMGTKYISAIRDEEPTLDPAELKKAAAIASVPGSLISGFLNAMGHGKSGSTFGSVLRALR